MNTYGQRLQHAMNLRQPAWNQPELARAIGVKKATVNQVLTGETQALNARNSALAARVLEVEHHWLATGEGEPRPLLMMERLGMSEKAVYLGMLFDRITERSKRDQAYAIIVQMLEFGAGDLLQPPRPGA